MDRTQNFSSFPYFLIRNELLVCNIGYLTFALSWIYYLHTFKSLPIQKNPLLCQVFTREDFNSLLQQCYYYLFSLWEISGKVAGAFKRIRKRKKWKNWWEECVPSVCRRGLIWIVQKNIILIPLYVRAKLTKRSKRKIIILNGNTKTFMCLLFRNNKK